MTQQYGSGGELVVTLGGPYAGGSGGTPMKLTTIILPVDSWKGAESPYSQVVTVEEVSVNSKVDLQPSVEQLQLLYDMDLVLTAVNDSGAVTVYAIGDKPTADLEIQATVSEVVA